jgi:hypothetical protein
MKRREQPAPERVHAMDDDGFDDEVVERGDDDSVPRAIHDPMQTAEVDIVRDRRVTLLSPIPAILAESMGQAPPPAESASRDESVPVAIPRGGEHTRRVGESGRHRVTPVRGSSLAQADAELAPWRQRAARHIDAARAALDAGDLTTAVTAAEAAMQEGDEAPPPGIVEVIEPARPLLTRVFTAYVGPLNALALLAPRAAEIAASRLGPRERALLARVDGKRTLEELFDGSGLGSTDAMRLAARLLRAGAIRIV